MRRYDKNDPTDRAWSSRVYQLAKKRVPEFLTENGGSGQFAEILDDFKQRNPDESDDSIGEPYNPKSAHWKHRVASALQTLKNTGVVVKGSAPGEWILGKHVATAPTVTPVQEDLSWAQDSLPPPGAPEGAQAAQ